ncbi:MAG: hypothetical protein V3V08_05290 [Nannocystaceae bacterium]
MSSGASVFAAHIQEPARDAKAALVRKELLQLKAETLRSVGVQKDPQLRGRMSDMYQDVVAKKIQLTAHVGVAVACALEVYDESCERVSISQFSRELRQELTEIGVSMKRRHSSRIARLVAEVEAQRLAWRHAHEFLSWLAFRRDDARYPAADRLERLEAFKVEQRLLQSRETLIRFLGHPMCLALEAHDRFMLGNRWRLSDTPEHRLERQAWRLLSFQPGEVIRLEQARSRIDALTSSRAPRDQIDAQREEVRLLLVVQLKWALERAPEDLNVAVL